ncbi:fibronectin type III domain protein [Lutibacter oceani]|uniref:Fibronectin type III domain protein n=1 Tax=Lutibacter oceani TaxID=1853311 RepID=A0A3D9RW68_9FLAO|nr:fibronectin type III domain-containing protein [Lutibacter oceani]REE81814.1 fibronectin type III domain protein [Lutibacter oceani]
MKKFIYTVVIGTLLWSCGGSGGDTPPDPTPENNAPSVPTLVYPSANLLCIDNSINFSWNASTDPDGDTVSYQIQIAKDNQFTEIVQSISNTSTTRTISLEKGVAYYWRVSAKDSKNKASSYSTANSFYTEGEGVSNYLPFSPEIVSPTLNAIVTETSAALEWNASDVDNDPLTFDVYFGTENPPTTIVSTNQTTKTYTVDVNASTDYFWKVVVKDDKGGETLGQVWNFKTD